MCAWPRANRVFILSLLVAIACSFSSGTDAVGGTAMAEANQLYENGALAEAAARYQALVDAGVQDGRLYYNLGNAYFKSGDIGRAVLNFRRAQRLLPRDRDVAANLHLARARTIDRIDGEGRESIPALVGSFSNWATLDEAATVALVLWIALCGLGIIGILSQSRQRTVLYLAGGIAALLALTVASISVRLFEEGRQPPAVIIAEEVSICSGPGEDYLVEFTLHAGVEVSIIERNEGWVRIALPGDLQGWTPDYTIVPVIQRNMSKVGEKVDKPH